MELRVVVCSALMLALAACGGNPRAPIENRQGPADTRKPPVMSSQATRPGTARQGMYTVQRGDTLYSIAWRHGLDFRALARANGVPAPYRIYPGQQLRLAAAPAPATAPVNRPAPKPAPQPRPPLVEAATKPPVSAPPVTKPSSPGGTTSPAATPAPQLGAVTAWRWPTEGRVVRGFSSSVHKGIDIGGNRGQAVNAVADGVVVYAGTGIVGFGELLIVKHNDTYLSAYGHNDRLLVAEGASVRAGQRIADMGSSGTDTVKLHFEIRRAGKPVDPIGLLPRR